MTSAQYVPDLLFAGDPGRTAILSADGELTYGQLRDRIAAVAQALGEAGAEPGDHVALRLNRSAEYVASLIAVLTVGAVAVPEDPEFPPERLAQIRAASRPRLTVYDAGAGRTPADHGVGWLDVDAMPPTARAYGEFAWRAAPADRHPAMVLFTSGSTGLPKGVRLHHAGLCNRLDWGRRRLGLTGDDRVLHKAATTFDAAIHEIFAPLIAGGVLVIAPPGVQYDSLGMVRLIQEAAVTTAHFVPSVLRHVVDEPELAYCTDLRRVLCGGEALDMDLVRRLRATLGCDVYNGYGPTETSVNATYWDAAEEFTGDIAPIGRPIDGVTTHVLADDLTPVPDGETGELWIGGAGVGLGYLGDQALTAQRFRPDPFARDGALMYRTGDLARRAAPGYLEFRGRVDDQVKVRGVRVEPEEVAAFIRRHPHVRDAAVLGVANPDGGVSLVAYVAARAAHAPVVGGLRRVRLPDGSAVATPNAEESLFLYGQIFDEGEYSRFGVRVADGDVVVDVGANIGLFSLWAHRQARDVRVVAIEPNPETLPYLRLNLASAGVDAQVLPVAVTEKPGTATLTSFPQMTYLSGIGEGRAAEATSLVRAYYRRAADAGVAEPSVLTSLAGDAEDRLQGVAHEVETADLSSLLDRCGVDRIDLLKINVEGAEEDVLRGIRPEHWPRIRQVCLEVERASEAGPRIEAMLREAGLRMHRIADWTLDAAADVTYVYAVREETRTDPATPSTAPHTDLLSARELRRYLAVRLPAAMTPERVVFVEDLPRLPNGKVARRDLPPPPQVPPAGTGAGADGPGGDRVERLREIWRRTLAVDGVVDDDDFLALGGHSLTALKVAVQVRRELGLAVRPRDCLRLGSFAAWAAAVLAADPAVAGA